MRQYTKAEIDQLEFDNHMLRKELEALQQSTNLENARLRKQLEESQNHIDELKEQVESLNDQLESFRDHEDLIY